MSRFQSFRRCYRADVSTIYKKNGKNGEHSTVIRVKQLREKAELFRRVARTPAVRDPLGDRVLALADQLDQQADEREEYLQRQAARDD